MDVDRKKRASVIGAGIVGVATAIWLQRDGWDVVLIDAQGPAAGASYGNAGLLASCAVIPANASGLKKKAPGMMLRASSPLFVRWSYLPKMLPWLVGFMRRANTRDTRLAATALTTLLYDSLEQHQVLARGTGAEKWIKPSDYLYIYHDRQAFEKDADDWSLRREMGFNWDELEGRALQDYDPIFQGSRQFGVRLEGHGTITDPGRYVEDLAAHFEREGGRITIAQAHHLEQQHGRVSGVVTSAGVIQCDAAVLAAGAWSKPLAEKLGAKTPLETERGYHIELVNPSIMPRAPMMLASGKFVITPMVGRMRCAGIVEFGGLHKAASKAPIDLLKRQIHEAVPNLTYDRIDEWMGHRPTLTDSIPAIGPLGSTQNAYAAFGHQHVGLTAGPKTGRLIADMMAGRKSNIDLAPFSPARFS